MKTNHATKILLALAATTIFGCSKGLQTQSSTSATNGSNGAQSTDPNSPAVTAPAIDQVQVKSKVEDPNNQTGLGGALAFDFDKTRGEFIIMVPLPQSSIFTASGAFPKYPDITFGPMFDATGKMKIAVRVPVKYIIKGLTLTPASKLPNGDPLPAMPAGAGELPALGLTFPADKTQITLYIGINALGLYATLPDNASLPIPFNITLPLKNQDKSRTFGYLTYVAAKAGFSSGLFISTGVPPQFARILEDYFHL
jgi:hypothetical protein